MCAWLNEQSRSAFIIMIMDLNCKCRLAQTKTLLSPILNFSYKSDQNTVWLMAQTDHNSVWLMAQTDHNSVWLMAKTDQNTVWLMAKTDQNSVWLMAQTDQNLVWLMAQTDQNSVWLMAQTDQNSVWLMAKTDQNTVWLMAQTDQNLVWLLALTTGPCYAQTRHSGWIRQLGAVIVRYDSSSSFRGLHWFPLTEYSFTIKRSNETSCTEPRPDRG